jgi:hypothetical protein
MKNNSLDESYRAIINCIDDGLIFELTVREETIFFFISKSCLDKLELIVV